MISDIKENRNQETQMTEDKSSSLPCKFDFDKKRGWLQTTKSGNRVYTNKHRGHGKVLGGANEFARANARDLRSAEKFPVNPQGVSDTILYHCLRHDYVFYPQDFTDINGVQRNRGYYDEECNHHENIRILYYPQSSGVACKFCGHNTIFDVNAQNMDDLWCLQCGAAINYMETLAEEYDFLVDCPGVFSYAKDISNPKEVIPEEVIIQYTNTKNVYVGIEEPLRYIRTRQFEENPIKEWKPNTELIIESNRNDSEEVELSSLDYDAASFQYFGEEGRTAQEMREEEIRKKIEQEELLRKQNEQKAFREKHYNEEHISKLDFDEPLQYIKTREYNPAPVVKQTYEPHKYNSKKSKKVGLKEFVRTLLELIFPIKEISTILKKMSPSDSYTNEFMEGPYYSEDKE